MNREALMSANVGGRVRRRMRAGDDGGLRESCRGLGKDGTVLYMVCLPARP